jgi:CRISPR-associated protein Cas2
MYLVVCYDVVNDRRRSRLMRRLREQLRHVQKSVFEGPLDEPRLVALRAMILDEIDPATDTVRIYDLCSRCQPATELLGTSVYVESEETDEVY